jgi:enoyl-CoA hydratase
MSHAMELLVKYETDEKVSIVTLNRPAKLNALSKELRVQLVDAFRKADDDPATCVAVLRAEGRIFCVGYDITGGDPDKEAWKHDALKWHENLREGLALEMMPWDMKKPVIDSVQGHALGGGCELAMLCDITIAASDASFGEPEVRFSDVGPAIVMPWLIGFKKARELLYMGDSINAEEALRLGMVNKVVPVDELPAPVFLILDWLLVPMTCAFSSLPRSPRMLLPILADVSAVFAGRIRT